MPTEEGGQEEASSLLRMVATDIHFWIPLLVLAAGLVLLHELR
jgi:hypothetical protein